METERKHQHGSEKESCYGNEAKTYTRPKTERTRNENTNGNETQTGTERKRKRNGNETEMIASVTLTKAIGYSEKDFYRER